MRGEGFTVEGFRGLGFRIWGCLGIIYPLHTHSAGFQASCSIRDSELLKA